MSKFHTLTVEDVIKETEDSVSIGFTIPSELTETFKYKPGQYLTLRFQVNGQDLRRSYSICTSPYSDKNIRVAIKKVKDGRVSSHINEKVKSGDRIEVMPPMGNFTTSLNPSNKKTYILFAGGSGITPMLSILKAVLEEEQQSNVVLIYGNRNAKSIIFNKQISQLTSENPNRLQVHHILEESDNSDELARGILTSEKTQKLIDALVNKNDQNEFFICGPTPMMMNVEGTLNNLGFPKGNIHLEYFSAPADTSEIVEKASGNIGSNEAFKSLVTIICDGDEKIIEMGAEDIILDKALEANLDAPYACRGGSCCTCRAKVIEGKVEMKINYALLDSEVEEGYVLTCQAQPLTPIVVINYDQGR